jgi:hypothetical protein
MCAILKYSGDLENKMIQRLLDADADVNLQCGVYGCPVAVSRESPSWNNQADTNWLPI